jgi:hypothetical protein
MCFSAAGSFAVAGVLTVMGAVSMTRNSSPPHRMFAAIPFVFAAQQATEGIVWLTIGGSHPVLHRMAVIAFLAFALVVWPIWLPASLRQVERSPARRRMLTTLLWCGSLVSAYAAFLMIRWAPEARIAGHSIRYDYAASTDTPLQVLHLVAYVVPTIVPFFLTTVSLARTMGITLVGSLVVTVLVERDALTSVWCFFAAILSGILFVALGREQRAVATLQAKLPSPSPT